MKRILFFAIIAFCEISFAQDCLYSDEVGKFTNTRTQTSNGAPFKSNGVTYNLYFIKVSSDSSSSYYLKFAKNTPGISSQYVTKGDKLIIMFSGGLKLELTASSSVKTSIIAQRSIVNVPYSISADDLFRISSLAITDIRFYHSDTYNDIIIKKPKTQSKIMSSANCMVSTN